MASALKKLPFFVVLMGLGSLTMMIPAIYGWATNDFVGMRVFFYGTILFGTLTLLVGLATAGYEPPNLARSQLLTLVAAFTVLPLMFAVPFAEATSNTSYADAWFEMVSSFTTTGATLFDTPGLISSTLHLWRATVGWVGGFLVWVVAIALFAPMNLGGFEVRSLGGYGQQNQTSIAQIGKVADSSERLNRYAVEFAPIYFGLTVVLWVILIVLGETPSVAVIHAMSTISTSGISPIGGTYFSSAGFWGEVAIVVFFVFAISRLTFSRGFVGETENPLWKDPEVVVAGILIFLATTLLFVRHFVGSIDEASSDIADAARALWGSFFTVVSFLTTTGFESKYWDAATDWSGLQTPGLLLMGLALIGGGVATTAGGVKLLRVYALFRHSEREMDRLLHPSSVGGGGKDARRIRRQGAYISWIFFMLFAISIATVMLLLSLAGIQFERGMVLAVAALSTTGPLATIAAESPIDYAGLPVAARAILGAAMVLGRLETLALIALFNPDFWRK